MRIRALSVFEGIVYHCVPMDLANPCRPTLEVEALLREGDADQGPLLVSVAEYSVMVGEATAARCVRELGRKGRITERMGVRYLVFPTWSPVADEPPLS
jgi:hypothetical protein